MATDDDRSAVPDPLTPTAAIRSIPEGAQILEARDIKVDFSGHQVLNGVSLAVNRGEVIAIIGPSGSGKSTFLRCFNLLQSPSAGHLTIGDTEVFSGSSSNIRSRDLLLLRRKVGMCFQSFNLFPHLTALENVVLAQVRALGRSKRDARTRGMQLLDRVGLSDRADMKPSQLSGGQQQRVAIARALALDPEIMLFDEPTSALDPELGVEVLAVMRELADEGMTMIIVTHEMHFAEDVADRVIFMADGNIVEEGTPKKVIRNPEHARTRKFLSAVIDR
ncbi:amino acid ABC transporter ATP-binding protein [Agromyces neolithicus]|uniref:Amino acid ABC transporter ATP-binding protein n=1 Tax=Agromyces neolithicus TaxID=269420 RepID=A0ABP4YJL9_9MICO